MTNPTFNVGDVLARIKRDVIREQTQGEAEADSRIALGLLISRRLESRMAATCGYTSTNGEPARFPTICGIPYAVVGEWAEFFLNDDGFRVTSIKIE